MRRDWRNLEGIDNQCGSVLLSNDNAKRSFTLPSAKCAQLPARRRSICVSPVGAIRKALSMNCANEWDVPAWQCAVVLDWHAGAQLLRAVKSNERQSQRLPIQRGAPLLPGNESLDRGRRVTVGPVEMG
jgi:hypothetical protein